MTRRCAVTLTGAMAERFTVLILAAGHGTRMHSSLPKVLHPICGKPMVEWVIDTARAAGASRVVCITRPGDGVAEALPDGVDVAEQVEGEGTGAAVLAAREHLEAGETVVVLSGDHPLVTAEQVTRLLDEHRRDGAAATLLTTEELDPSGYGRVVRGEDGSVECIVETKYPEGVPPEELAIREIHIGTYAFDGVELVGALDRVGLENDERYLTGAVPVIREAGGKIAAHLTDETSGALGINDRAQLMEAERIAQQRLLSEHARAGVTFLSPQSTRVEAGVEIGPDTVVGVGCTLAGRTRIGKGVELGPHTTVIDSSVGDGSRVIQAYLVEAELHERVSVGPFAYLRPGTIVREGAKIGTFVEVKNSDIGRGAKVPHLSYVGDAEVGDEANLGASTITANYDGRRKHRTKVGKRAKISVHTTLVAPVDVGDGAYTGAGSAITEDIPDGALGIARPRQENVEGYAKRVEEERE
jgi:bifunctional UDP-N-acetylglucosamine pyrophosphorylase / glucosamine-1-phosphate N-acetyltransferase